MNATMRHFQGNERRKTIPSADIAAEQAWWSEFYNCHFVRSNLMKPRPRSIFIVRDRELLAVIGAIGALVVPKPMPFRYIPQEAFNDNAETA